METTQERFVGLSWLASHHPVFSRRTWMEWAEDGKLRGAFKIRLGRGPGRWAIPLSSALALLHEGVDPRPPKDSFPTPTQVGEEREDRTPIQPVLAEA